MCGGGGGGERAAGDVPLKVREDSDYSTACSGCKSGFQMHLFVRLLLLLFFVFVFVVVVFNLIIVAHCGN